MSEARPLFERLALIGLGLEGSSIAWAAKRGGLVGEIVGHARTARTRARALEIGFCDRVTETVEEVVAGADLVILCVPVGVCGPVAEAIGPHLAEDAIVSDVGSVKVAVIEAVGPHIPAHAHFVPAHPLAGTEHSGPDSGFAELFDGRWCFLTPQEGDAPEPVARMRAFWQGLGSQTAELTPEHHDLVVSVTSHVPHAIAYTMVGVADHLRRVTNEEVIQFSAGGFRDFTRIAASDPTMWRDVFLNNREATLDILGRFAEELFVLQRAIRMGDGDFLHSYFSRTREIRRSIVEAGQDTDAPDFGRVPTAAQPGDTPAADEAR